MKKKGLFVTIFIVCICCAVAFAACNGSNENPDVTSTPGATDFETLEPTEEVNEPTDVPTDEPTDEPTAEPTKEPTEEPTTEPTEEPTAEPTAEPTTEPTAEPTAEPTDEPTTEPTAEPTNTPTPKPTNTPTPKPTNTPTPKPTNTPTPKPTNTPTPKPTNTPTPKPTNTPTPKATNTPTPKATNTPTPEVTNTVMYKLDTKNYTSFINFESGTSSTSYKSTMEDMGLTNAGISFIDSGITQARVCKGTYALSGKLSLLTTSLNMRTWSLTMVQGTGDRIFMEFKVKFGNTSNTSNLIVCITDSNVASSNNEGTGGMVLTFKKGTGSTVDIYNATSKKTGSISAGETHTIAFSFVKNSNKYDIYVDGSLISSNNSWIGKLNSVNAYRFDVTSNEKVTLDDIILTWGSQVTEEEYYATPSPTPTLAPSPTPNPSEKVTQYVNSFSSDTTMTVGNANETGLNAFGVEWDPHFWRSHNTTSRSGDQKVDEEDWELVLRRAKELGIQKARMWVMPSWYEPTNDNSDPNVTDLSKFNFSDDLAVNRNYASLIKQLDFCEENGIDVNITIWGGDSWLFFTHCGSWISAPNDADEYAENVAALFDNLFNVRKYTCVKELTINNEPDSSFLIDNGTISHDYYVTVCKKVDQKLKDKGLRDKIKMILSDDINGNTTWLSNTVNKLNDVADGYDSHTYLFGKSSSYSQMYNWEKNLQSIVDSVAPEKQYTHNEFGGNQTVGAYRQLDINEYYRGVYYARMMCAFMNAGSNGMLHWCFYDEYYNDGVDDGDINVNGGSRMMIGLFAYKDQDWEIRPFYHAWGLIMKYTRRDSSVYPISTSRTLVQGTAFKSPEGKWSYVIVNSDESNAHKICLTEKETNIKELYVHVYTDSANLTDERVIPASSMAYEKDGKIYIEIPANSFVMITELG